jgi:hypothetical protein
VLEQFRLKRSQLVKGGGSKSDVSRSIDSFLYQRGWGEVKFLTKIVVDGVETDSPTHKVDCFKNRIALEIEWNNKDPFYDRDLNNFRLLFDLRAISVGVIVTRCDELQGLVASLGRGSSIAAHLGWRWRGLSVAGFRDQQKTLRRGLISFGFVHAVKRKKIKRAGRMV